MKPAAAAVAFLLLAMLPSISSAQSCPPPRAAAAGDPARADIVLVARVQAESIRFDSQPEASGSVTGCPQLDTARVVVRTNLPKPVSPGVTYRNVAIDVRLRTRFSEIDCLLADILPAVAADSVQIRGAQSACLQRDTKPVR